MFVPWTSRTGFDEVLSKERPFKVDLEKSESWIGKRLPESDRFHDKTNVLKLEGSPKTIKSEKEK